MTVELDREEIKVLIYGVESSISTSLCVDYEKLGWMIFTGNQHNESWSFLGSYLDTMDEYQLWEFYQSMKLSTK